MIEITHIQAQRLIREAQDRQLPDEQWAVLQSHLESCPQCLAYQKRLASYDRDLHRTLRSRWSGAHGPVQDVSGWLLSQRARRKTLRKFLNRAMIGVLALLLLTGYFTYRRMTTPPPRPTSTPFSRAAASVKGTGTPQPAVTFPGLVAFESHRDGNSEIYLMKYSPNGAELTNLTQNPADETSPSWSPDGEWIAFLSTRTGKNEVFVETVAGSRVTQLTDDPLVDWQGPLNWSADGQSISLVGQRAGSSWLYLVPLDGSAPSSIARTRGISGSARFSSALWLIAFASPSVPGSLEIVNSRTGWKGMVTWTDNQTHALLDGRNDAFDWSLGGRNLVYVADGPFQNGNPEQPGENARSEIRLSEEILANAGETYQAGESEVLDSAPQPGTFRAVSWVPNTLLVAALQNASDDQCWQVRLYNASNHEQAARDLRGLCVEGSLERAQWSSDGRWVVLMARQPGESQLSYYALRIPDEFRRLDTTQPVSGNAYFERLLDMSVEQAGQSRQPPGLPTWAEPKVRPVAKSLGLAPRPVQRVVSRPLAVYPTADVPGWIVYTLKQGANSQIIRMRPDGSGRMALTGIPYENACPRLSPDGQVIAFVSDRASAVRGHTEIFRMDIDGKNTVQLTEPRVSAAKPANTVDAPLRYSCPVWSPDGKQLAAVLTTPEAVYLAIIPIDSSLPVKYLQIKPVSELSAPVWIPKDAANPSKGSDQILMVYTSKTGPASLIAVDVAQSRDGQPALSQEKRSLVGWEDAMGLSLSPDGKYLATILQYRSPTSTPNGALSQIGVMDLFNYNLANVGFIPNYNKQSSGWGGLSWTSSNQVGLVEISSMVGPEKTIFQQLNIGQDNALGELTSFEDVVYQAVWSQNGWVVFSAESGLWALDTHLAQAGQAAPAQLSAEVISDFDWR